MYGDFNCLAAIRDQPVDIVDAKEASKICTVKAGPKTQIANIKLEVEQDTGIPVRNQMLKYGDYNYKDGDHLGIHVFKDLQPGAIPVLNFEQLSADEADAEEGRKQALENVLNGQRLIDLEERYRADPEIVLSAVETTNASELQHAADSVKADKDTMLEALKISSSCMYYVADSLWNDRKFMISAVSVDGMLLGASMVPPEWRSDNEVVRHACEENGYALQLSSEELRSNRAVVIAAVNQRGTALMYASDELRRDYNVVLDAVRNNRMAIVHAKGGLRDDDDIRAAAGRGPMDHIDHDKVERIKAKFNELDENGDGFLSYEELEALLKQGNPDMDEEEVRLLYDEMNTHHDGRVDFHEFCDWIFAETADHGSAP